MGRHSAPRRNAPAVALGAAVVVGSAGIAWAVGEEPAADAGKPSGATVSPSRGSAPLTTAPTPRSTATRTPVVLVVPSEAPEPTVAPTTATSVTTTAPAPAPEVTPQPEPTRTRPDRPTPSPKPTKPSK